MSHTLEGSSAIWHFECGNVITGLPHIKRYYRGSEKGRQSPRIKPRIPGLCSQCSATELWQPDNHQPPQSSICTAQVGLKWFSRTLGSWWLPTFSLLYFHLITSKFSLFQHEARVLNQIHFSICCLQYWYGKWSCKTYLEFLKKKVLSLHQSILVAMGPACIALPIFDRWSFYVAHLNWVFVKEAAYSSSSQCEPTTVI